MINLRLKKLRESQELSQIKMSKLLKVSKTTYARWENQEIIIPLKRLNDCCNYFNISMDYMLGLSNTNMKFKKVLTLDKKAIGNNLKEIRIDKNLTQEKLACVINTTHSTISAYENGKTLILTAFAYEICKKYNYSMDWLCNRR